MPNEWRRSMIIIPIFKNKSDIQNYEIIAGLNSWVVQALGESNWVNIEGGKPTSQKINLVLSQGDRPCIFASKTDEDISDE